MKITTSAVLHKNRHSNRSFEVRDMKFGTNTEKTLFQKFRSIIFEKTVKKTNYKKLSRVRYAK